MRCSGTLDVCINQTQLCDGTNFYILFKLELKFTLLKVNKIAQRGLMKDLIAAGMIVRHKMVGVLIRVEVHQSVLYAFVQMVLKLQT